MFAFFLMLKKLKFFVDFFSFGVFPVKQLGNKTEMARIKREWMSRRIYFCFSCYFPKIYQFNTYIWDEMIIH